MASALGASSENREGERARGLDDKTGEKSRVVVMRKKTLQDANS